MEVMRNQRLVFANRPADVPHALLSSGKQVDDAQAGRFPDAPQKTGLPALAAYINGHLYVS
jgi:hypothetical protein